MLKLLRARRFAPLFWTQLFGAFNDNFFKSALVVTLTFGAMSSTELSTDALVNLSTALLVLPFFLFSAVAGQLADRIDKSRLIRILKMTELGVMVIALIGFTMGSLPLLFAALFMMGTQSAFFGPVKYAILPQHLADEELLGANGLVEMGTFVAILAGTIVGALVVAVPGIGIPLVGASLIAVSLAGIFSARFVPSAPPSGQTKVDWNLVRGTVETIRIGRREQGVWRSILGASWFWGVGAFVLGQMPRLAETLGGDERALTWMLSAFSVGIAIGSVICEKMNAGRIEVGRVPFAGVMMSISLVGLAYATTIVWACVALAALGFFGGMFIVPLYAFMQHEAKEEERSRVIAANNIVNAAFMVGAAIYAMVRLGSGVELSSLVLEVAILHGVATIVAAVFVHRGMIRLTIGRIVRTMYRVDVEGLEAIPAEGAALVVANHQSFIDAFILGGLSQREIRFVMDHRMAQLPGMRWFFRLTGAIPIASRKDDPKILEAAFEEIDAALANGELVGIFPEGMCTRDGETNVFKPGVEKILQRRPVPVVPIALDGLWGSFFSYRHGYPMKSFPRRFWSKIRVVAGKPRSPQLSADELREVVERLRGSVG